MSLEETLLERSENPPPDLEEGADRVRVDGLLSALSPLGITAHLPDGQVCSPLAELNDIEEMNEGEAEAPNKDSRRSKPPTGR